ncbi:carbohydrate-binding X8 domain-containing protein-like [Amaranthus tricolor]|uniref:carbohydrate-binding X8 domain-containing protein-like n=1 Tax=Amaranthus tricolor TaxID=29722 RepID=UPI0025884EE3|nr:carbohydrate-binding X8 domain-containing protein-like [Amaranthus tricolor]
MKFTILQCLSVLILLVLNSGSNAEVTRQSRMYDTYPTMIMHETYPIDIPPDNPTDDLPTFNPTPTTTPTAAPSTIPPNPPITNSPNIPTMNPTPMSADGGGGGGGGSRGEGGTGSGGGGAWCVANPSASEKALQVGLDYACGFGGADCSTLQSGASCFDPNSVKDHASYAYNAYYQKNPAPPSCDFGGTAQLVYTDPSSGNCHYSSSKASTSTTPTTQTTPTPVMQIPPTTFGPPTSPFSNFPGPPFSGGSGFVPEPTGSPNMAACMSQQWLLVFSSTSILMYNFIAND